MAKKSDLKDVKDAAKVAKKTANVAKKSSKLCKRSSFQKALPYISILFAIIDFAVNVNVIVPPQSFAS